MKREVFGRGVAIVTVSVTVVFAGVGCVRPRAASIPSAPPLEVPAPPARVFTPPEEPLPAAASVPETPVPGVTPGAPRPPAPRRAGVPPPEAEPRPETPAATAGASPDPSRELRAAPSATDAPAERSVRELLARSTRDLGRVNVGRLSADGRAQFEQARRFAQQAQQALGARNVIFAATLADKAASLAADLANR